MNREEYLNYRLHGNYLPIIYEYINNVHGKKISIDNIRLIMSFQPFVKNIINECVDFFDKKFTITILTYNDKILKIY